jgi:hypothetical protein
MGFVFHGVILFFTLWFLIGVLGNCWEITGEMKALRTPLRDAEGGASVKKEAESSQSNSFSGKYGFEQPLSAGTPSAKVTFLFALPRFLSDFFGRIR